MTPEQLRAIEPMTRAELQARGWSWRQWASGRGNTYTIILHTTGRIVEISDLDDTEARRAATVLSILWGLV